MDIDLEERMARIHELELERVNNLHTTDLIYRDEEARLLKLRALCLQDENASLKDKIAAKDIQIGALTKQRDRLRVDLDDGKGATRSQETRLKKQAMEITNLKAEIDSLNEATQDSSKTMQEKFALTRELNRIRPEVEHLRTQLANYDTMVAEKRDLQRQLDSLEVELENEKRSRQRALNKENDTVTNELKTKLDKAEKKLASEKKERESTKAEHEQALAEAQSHSSTMEERITKLNAKLKTTQVELKDAKDELEKCRMELVSSKSAASRPAQERPKKVSIIKPEPSRKRRQVETSFGDVTIATPGDDDFSYRKQTKKRGVDHTAFGEKSNFSITPFLNRTRNASDESLETPVSVGPKVDLDPESEPEFPEDACGPEPEPEPPAPKAQPSVGATKTKTKAAAATAKAQKPRAKAKAKGLAEASASEKNVALPPSEQPVSDGKFASLEQTEERPLPEDKENSALQRRKRDPPTKAPESEAIATANTSLLGGDGAKRKRKLLGGGPKLAFDSEDGDIPHRPTKVQIGATRRLKAPLGGAANAFGTAFSPLKRDRRGVNASFIS